MRLDDRRSTHATADRRQHGRARAKTRSFGRLGVAFFVLVAAGCFKVGPDHRTPDVSSLTDRELAGDPALRELAEEPAARWWLALADPMLDQLVDSAFERNRDLRVAAANVAAARAALGQARVALRPTAEGQADYRRRQLAGATFGIDDADFPESDLFTLGAVTSWEIDFFGRVRRSVEAARAELERDELLRRDAESLVASETVQAYVDHRGAELLLAVARQNLEVQRRTLELTVARLEEGLGSRLDVARASAQAKTTEAAIPPIEAARVAAANRLATLIGSPLALVEASLAETRPVLPASPPQVAIGDVASLLVRRTDVRAAERELAAATARIGIAKGDYYPRILLTGSVQTSAQRFADLGTNPSLAYAMGPSLTWIGFDFPRVRLAVRAAGARAEAALAAYERSVLVAVQEVQTTLAAYGRERVRFETLSEASVAARDAASLARERFEEGVDDFLAVLDSEGRLLDAEASAARSRIEVTSRFVDVHRALGVGWRVDPSGPIASVPTRPAACVGAGC